MYRVRNPRGGLFVRAVEKPKHRFPGDTKAYYTFTLEDAAATEFGCWADADMARVLLQMPTLEVVDGFGNRVSSQQAIAFGTYHSPPPQQMSTKGRES